MNRQNAQVLCCTWASERHFYPKPPSQVKRSIISAQDPLLFKTISVQHSGLAQRSWACSCSGYTQIVQMLQAEITSSPASLQWQMVNSHSFWKMGPTLSTHIVIKNSQVHWSDWAVEGTPTGDLRERESVKMTGWVVDPPHPFIYRQCVILRNYRHYIDFLEITGVAEQAKLSIAGANNLNFFVFNLMEARSLSTRGAPTHSERDVTLDFSVMQHISIAG